MNFDEAHGHEVFTAVPAKNFLNVIDPRPLFLVPCSRRQILPEVRACRFLPLTRSAPPSVTPVNNCYSRFG